jgi:hypothetical protein
MRYIVSHTGHSGANGEKKLLQNSNFLEICQFKSHQSSQVNQGIFILGNELIPGQIYRANFYLLAYLLNFTTPCISVTARPIGSKENWACRGSHGQPSPWSRSKSEGGNGVFRAPLK